MKNKFCFAQITDCHVAGTDEADWNSDQKYLAL